MLQAKFQEIKKSTFFHDVLHSFVSKGVYIGLGFVGTILIVRNLTVEAYGEYTYLLSIALTCFQFAHLGFSSANTYYVVRNKRLLPFLISNTKMLSTFVGGILLVVLLILNYVYFHRELDVVVLTALIVPFQVMSELNKGLLLGIKKVKISNYLELLSRFIYTVLIVVIAIYYQSVVLLLSAYLFQMVLLSISSLFSLKKRIKRELSPSINLFKKMSNYSVRIYIVLFLSFLVLKIDIYIIENMLGEKSLGIYSLGATLASNLILIIKVIIPLLLPKLSEIKGAIDKIMKLKNIVLYATLLLIIINVTFLFCGEWVIVIVFGEKYVESVISFKILLLASSILSLESILAQYFVTIGKVKFLIYYWIFVLSVNIILNYLWIPIYGINGAAWASLVSYFLMFVLLVAKTIREVSMIRKTNNIND